VTIHRASSLPVNPKTGSPPTCYVHFQVCWCFIFSPLLYTTLHYSLLLSTIIYYLTLYSTFSTSFLRQFLGYPDKFTNTLPHAHLTLHSSYYTPNTLILLYYALTLTLNITTQFLGYPDKFTNTVHCTLSTHFALHTPHSTHLTPYYSFILSTSLLHTYHLSLLYTTTPKQFLGYPDKFTNTVPVSSSPNFNETFVFPMTTDNHQVGLCVGVCVYMCVCVFMHTCVCSELEPEF
jgi:hypothetical protein